MSDDRILFDRDNLLRDWFCPDCEISLSSDGRCTSCGSDHFDATSAPFTFELGRYFRRGHIEVIGVGDTLTPPVIPNPAKKGGQG